ncbi:hypothetical protein BP5796_05022 [Coleophoma crateriformis]|uniref:Erythromycin biosynthesis protein CIII-like C-terminal domain-containing protein n=1 Tax=Coleophoma crateriformis TaxID=565419 RepID=A0A3D8S2L6_9HELO|nr:hypothetical protein BP5796_05022 [Coleophoma crateriformis]
MDSSTSTEAPIMHAEVEAPPLDQSILFLTNEEHGQSNVMFAIIYELLTQHRTKLHVASWDKFLARLDSAQILAQEEYLSENLIPIELHRLPSESMVSKCMSRTRETQASFRHAPGYRGMSYYRSFAPTMLAAYEPTDYMSIYFETKRLVEEIEPNIIVLDPFLSSSIDFVRMSGRKHVILSPVSPSAYVVPKLPLLQIFCKYPTQASGLPFPLPWAKVPENVWTILNGLYVLLFDRNIKELDKVRREQGITWPLPIFEPLQKGVPLICPSLPTIDYPIPWPSDLEFVGPIVAPYKSPIEDDPDLWNWLQQGHTVIICLGTHALLAQHAIMELAKGLRILLDQCPKVQILWKLKKDKDFDKSATLPLLTEIDSGRVRLTEWIKSDLAAVLQTGSIICIVHHGGANSFFEATWAGIPQIIVAQWHDTYEYAAKVEYLGIGVYGNKTCAPDLYRREFGEALVLCTGSSKSSKEIQERANALGLVSQKRSGRKLAVAKLREILANVATTKPSPG